MSSPKKRGSSAEAAPPPVIVIKKVARHKGGHHGGAWKVAYADFVTTMMALFIVLWAAAQSPQVKASIANYFRNPRVPVPVSGGQGDGVLPSSTGVVAAEAAPSPPRDAAAEEASLERAADEVRSEFAKDPDLRELADQVKIEVTPEGLRIQIVENDKTLFFEVGSARLTPALARLLGVIAKVVGRLPNLVIVEGHTDARQYSQRRDYSNWELSAERANSARRVLESSGLRAGQVGRVVGFADHDLLVKDRPLDTQNRRVSIIVSRGSFTGKYGERVDARQGLEQARARRGAEQ